MPPVVPIASGSPGTVPGRSPGAPPDTIRCGPLEASYSQTDGIRLSFDGVPVSRQSSLVVVDRGWTHVFFNSEREPATVTTRTMAGICTMDVVSQNDTFRSEYQVELTQGGIARVTLTGRLLKAVTARMEYAASYLSADPVAGATFHAETSSGAASGVVPFAALSPDEGVSRLSAPFTSLTFDSRIGPVRLDIGGDRGPYVIFDARKNVQAWARVWPMFWVGLFPGDDLPVNQEFRTSVTWTFAGPGPSAAVVDTASLPASSVRPAGDITVPFSPDPVLIPRPRFSRVQSSLLRLTNDTLIVAGGGQGDQAAAESVHSDLLRRFRLDLRMVPASYAAASWGLPVKAILIGTAGSPWGRAVAALGAAEPPTQAEGYALRSGPGQVWLCGRDDAGTYYAAQTLEELFGADRDGVYVHDAVVADYPFMSFRGAHLFPSHEGLAFQDHLIDRVLSHFKLNKLVLESEYTRWDSHPELAQPWSPSKADLADEIATARHHFMDPIPLVQTLGHSEWIFRTGHHDDLKEDPESDFAYDPTNPATYQLVFDIFREAIDLFHPQIFHIGHDEVTDRGRFPFRSAGPGHTVTSLFVDDTRRLWSFLRERGVKTMIWGDMLLAPGEAGDATTAPNRRESALRRDALPKDIVVSDWHYTGRRSLPSVGILELSGFKTVASTWFDPVDIQSFSWDAYVRGSEGLLQTTWAGYHTDEETLKSSFPQFTAFVLAADYGWSPRPELPADLPYDPADVFRAAFSPVPVDRTIHPGFTVDLSRRLSPDASVALSSMTSGTGRSPSAEAPGWLGYGPDHDLAALPTGSIRLGGVRYDVPAAAIVLGGTLLPPRRFPQEVVIPLNRLARQVRFLVTTGWTGQDGAVGSATFDEGAGAPPVLVFVRGRNVSPWTDLSGLPQASLVWRGRTRAGEPVGVREVVWDNPNPARPVKQIILRCLDSSAAPIFLGITGVN